MGFGRRWVSEEGALLWLLPIILLPAVFWLTVWLTDGCRNRKQKAPPDAGLSFFLVGPGYFFLLRSCAISR